MQVHAELRAAAAAAGVTAEDLVQDSRVLFVECSAEQQSGTRNVF